MRNTLGIILCVGLLVGIRQYVRQTHHDRTASVSTESRMGPRQAKARGALSRPNPSTQRRILGRYENLPLAFEKNEGQSDAPAKFLAHGPGYALFLNADEAVLSLDPGTGERNFSSANTKAGQGDKVQFSHRQDSEQPANGMTLRMRLIGANTEARIQGLDELYGKTNYFIGSDPRNWHANIANYAKVKYSDVYPGVNLVYYGSHRQLEYDFVVAPHADPNAIRFAIGTSEKAGKGHTPPLRISADGDLIVKIDRDEVRFHKPIAYQEDGLGSKHLVEARYTLGRRQQVNLSIGPYDRRKSLVIDPVLSYSTYLGPSDEAVSIAVDTSGNTYVTGTAHTGFPTTSGAFQTTCPNDCFLGRNFVPFVAKFNAAGSALVYSTYLAPSDGGFASASDVAVDSAGDAYVVGSTESPSFPTTAGAFQTVCRDCSEGSPTTEGAFIAKLNSTGSALVYATYIAGSTEDSASGVAVDPSGDAYITGSTTSADFPVTPGSFQSTYQSNGDAFVTELNPVGSALIYSTYLGGSKSGGVRITASSAGNAYVVGGTQSSGFPTTPGAFQTTCAKCSSGTDSSGHPLQAAFITELNSTGSALVYSTFLGGSDADFPEGMALDSSGNAYITGVTYSDDFPTTPGAFQTACGGGNCSGQLADAFVSKLNSSGSTLVYSTYLGGNSYDFANAIAVDSAGDAYIGGGTVSLDFPVTPSAFQTQCNNCSLTNYVTDAFLSELNPSGASLLYSTYLGGSNEDYTAGIALDTNSNVYLAGGTNSTDFPTTAGSYQPTASSSSAGAFVAKFAFGSTQSGSAASVTPPNLDFGSVVAGSNSTSQKITLSSTGSTALSISNIGISGTNSSDFSQTNNCGTSVAAGTTCTITVTFSPTSTGTMSASVDIADDASDSPQSISLGGTGTDFSLSAATGSNCPSGANCSTSATVTAGQTATYDLQVSPVSGFNGTVSFGCTDALAESTCSVSPNSATLNGTAASAFTVTVTTTAKSVFGPFSMRDKQGPLTDPIPVIMFLLALASLLSGSIVAARSPRRRVVPVLAVLVLALMWTASCGGGGSNGGGGGNSGTPSGTVTITGSSSGVNHSASLNLTVN